MLGKWSIIGIALVLVTGCSAALGNFPPTSETKVRLSENNYRIIRPNVIGTSNGFSLLGIIPLKQPKYIAAMTDLCNEGYRSSTGSVALANVAAEYSGTYLILFSVPRISVRADIVEFIDRK